MFLLLDVFNNNINLEI